MVAVAWEYFSKNIGNVLVVAVAVAAVVMVDLAVTVAVALDSPLSLYRHSTTVLFSLPYNSLAYGNKVLKIHYSEIFCCRTYWFAPADMELSKIFWLSISSEVPNQP